MRPPRPPKPPVRPPERPPERPPWRPPVHPPWRPRIPVWRPVWRPIWRPRGRGRGDPHYVTLDGKDVLFNGLGDYIFAETTDGSFTAHVRIDTWAGEEATATVNKGIAVKLGNDVVEFSSQSRKFYLNKDEASFEVGKKYELDGGFLLRKTRKSFIIKADNGAELFGELFVLHDGRSYLDLQIDASEDVEFSRGLILDGKDSGKAIGLFRTHKRRRVMPKTKIDIPEWATEQCAKRGLTGKSLKDCAYDAAVTGKEFAKEIAKDEAKFKRRSDKVAQKKKKN